MRTITSFACGAVVVAVAAVSMLCWWSSSRPTSESAASRQSTAMIEKQAGLTLPTPTATYRFEAPLAGTNNLSIRLQKGFTMTTSKEDFVCDQYGLLHAYDAKGGKVTDTIRLRLAYQLLDVPGVVRVHMTPTVVSVESLDTPPNWNDISKDVADVLNRFQGTRE